MFLNSLMEIKLIVVLLVEEAAGAALFARAARGR